MLPVPRADLTPNTFEYEITPLGKTIVQAEIVRLDELLQTGKRIAGGRML